MDAYIVVRMQSLFHTDTPIEIQDVHSCYLKVAPQILRRSLFFISLHFLYNSVLYASTFHKVEAIPLQVALVNLVVSQTSLAAVEVSADYLNRRNSMKLYVGDLYHTMPKTDLGALFNPHGSVLKFNITNPTIFMEQSNE